MRSSLKNSTAGKRISGRTIIQAAPFRDAYLCSMNLPNIRQLSEQEIRDYVAKTGEKPFRAKQIQEWLWQKNAHDFDAMSNLSQAFRQQLKNDFS